MLNIETWGSGLWFKSRSQLPISEVPMTYDEIVAVLGFAGSSDQPVRILTTNKMEVVGVPTSVDAHIEAHEVYLLPPGADETEIAVNLGAIESVELM
jgi:hypothetical protein